MVRECFEMNNDKMRKCETYSEDIRVIAGIPVLVDIGLRQLGDSIVYGCGHVCLRPKCVCASKGRSDRRSSTLKDT